MCIINIMLYPVHYPTRDLLRRLGLLKQGVTIFIITQMTWTQKKYYHTLFEELTFLPISKILFT